MPFTSAVVTTAPIWCRYCSELSPDCKTDYLWVDPKLFVAGLDAWHCYPWPPGTSTMTMHHFNAWCFQKNDNSWFVFFSPIILFSHFTAFYVNFKHWNETGFKPLKNLNCCLAPSRRWRRCSEMNKPEVILGGRLPNKGTSCYKSIWREAVLESFSYGNILLSCGDEGTARGRDTFCKICTVWCYNPVIYVIYVHAT